MNKKRRNGYVSGFICFIGSLVFLIFAFNMGYNVSGQISGGIGVIFLLLGCGSIAKPETIGAVTTQFLDNISRNVESGESSSQSNTQEHTNNSTQINAKGSVNVYNNAPKEKTEQKTAEGGKSYSCPNGHATTVFPPDDSHPLVARNAQEANKKATGSVIPQTHICSSCNDKFTLYWYKEKKYFMHISNRFTGENDFYEW
ncbi:MAG: hypothetical protein LBH62_04570 [Nitrososphaerota archaeon]|jgi:long-subunit fatty acid transport protein|nr:hypothetical protein [Nitrososphaerota archaeon]